MRRQLIALLAGLALALTAVADDFPSRPLTMLIGFNPGGSTDIQGIVLAEVLSEELGQPVEVLHYPGRGGGVAAAMLASSLEGGYVFQFGLSNPFVFTPLTTNTSYDAQSFRYVAGVTLDQPAIVTGPDTPFSTWEGMLEYGRERGELIYATQNPHDQYVMETLMAREGIDLRILPTTGGAGMAPLIINGEADVAFSGGTHSAYTDDGLMRLLASPTRERLMAYPDTPTLLELGYDLEMHAYRVLAVPRDTPDSHVDRLREALRVAAADSRFVDVTESKIRMPTTFVTEDKLSTLFQNQIDEFHALTEQ
ncbi:tripartite tricarboxylate transporter substrate binding protein [Natronospirillum operosum]|nr:tripartite tricarboxylate transporter substrate binding protein [Natronospirillum operosum]